MSSSVTTGEPVLEIQDLSVDYGYDEHAVPVLRGVDLTLHKGEVLGLAGESGCGKSTLAYAATRLLPPPGLITGGQVLFHGRDGRQDVLTMTDAQLRAARWEEVAIVFQGAMNSLNPVYRVGRQLMDAMTAHRPGTAKSVHRARAGELLEMVGISGDRMSAYPHQLSGGMRQRVMIAMALALEPKVVIMDEPTTALDVVIQRQIMEQISALRRDLGFAVVFITHDLSLLIELADRIAIMYAGGIVESAPAQDLYRRPRHPYTYSLLHSFPSLHGPRRQMTGIPGAPPDLSLRPPGCPFEPRCAHAFADCTTSIPELTGTVFAEREPQRTVACFQHDHDPESIPDTLTHL